MRVECDDVRKKRGRDNDNKEEVKKKGIGLKKDEKMNKGRKGMKKKVEEKKRLIRKNGLWKGFEKWGSKLGEEIKWLRRLSGEIKKEMKGEDKEEDIDWEIVENGRKSLKSERIIKIEGKKKVEDRREKLRRMIEKRRIMILKKIERGEEYLGKLRRVGIKNNMGKEGKKLIILRKDMGMIVRNNMDKVLEIEEKKILMRKRIERMLSYK